MASRLVWAKNLDILRFSYRRIVVRCNPLTVWKTKTLVGKYKFKNSKKKKSLSWEGCYRSRDDGGIQYDAAQPPIVMVVMMVLLVKDNLPDQEVPRLAGLLCKTGMMIKGASLVDF